MQIVRNLGGYTLGRSDLVRRAMSKKKGDVMQRERQNFVYGNPEEGVPGCAAKGISPEIANLVFDEMTDFAKYAFNKSHAACYAVVSYQTAYLKYYYPVEFMAALMTSVIDNSLKVSEYIRTCRNMNIPLLPPDINEGEWEFSAHEGSIRYGLSAIKSIGRNVIESITAEREAGGPYTSLKDFIERLSTKEVNKRTLENLILSGAMDGLPGNRRQKMLIYADLMDQKNREKKEHITGQMSLFDLMGEEERKDYEVRMPDVEEYEKAELLQFEKEVLGVYISGHPLEDDEKKWKNNITATAADFVVDPETGHAVAKDGSIAVIGGIITSKNLKITKNNQTMAFLTLEDLTGTIEIIVFPKDYENNRSMLEEEKRVFIRGRVTHGEDAVGKLVCERVIEFSPWPKELWVKFADKAAFDDGRARLLQLVGGGGVTLFLEKQRLVKRATASLNEPLTEDDIYRIETLYGKDNVRMVDKTLDEIWKKK